MNNADKQEIIQYLKNHFSKGRPILFTGSGFSSLALNLVGNNLPFARGLAEEIWKLIYPSDEFEEDNTLQDIFETAIQLQKNNLTDCLKNQLTIDPSKSDLSIYSKIFSLPWYRIYTLNIDNLIKAVNARYSLPRKMVEIDGMPGKEISPESYGSIGSKLFAIHMHGVLDKVPDGITFGRLQYAQRASSIDTSYARLVAEMNNHPFVFIGTTLDEPSLWKYLELRGQKGPRGMRERRPKSYLVSRSIPKTRKNLLEGFNIQFVGKALSDFYESILKECESVIPQGIKALDELSRASQESIANDQALFLIEKFLDDLKGIPIDATARNFLFGSEPNWNDVRCGAASKRNCEKEVLEKFYEVFNSESTKVLVISGTAGTGKSTVAKRLALKIMNEGHKIAWIDQNYRPHPPIIRKALAEKNGPDILFIEDANIYKNYLDPLIRELFSIERKITIVVILRSHLVQRYFGVISKRKNFIEISIPHLTDEDVDGILQCLDNYNRLGALKGKSLNDQRIMFKAYCGRQLLVAMISATSGDNFDQKCISEYKELTEEQKGFYEIAVVASKKGIQIVKNDLIVGTEQNSNEDIELLDQLINRGLLVSIHGRIAIRHKVIAERVFNHLSSEKSPREAIAGLIFALCGKLELASPRQNRTKRDLGALINHEFLFRSCGKEEPKRLYEEFENLLSNNHHFWLQRGSFHVEYGELDLAINFLNQAYGLCPDDPLVLVERSYLNFKLAYKFPSKENSQALAKEAMDTLNNLISYRGAKDPYPYHVLGSQGLSWSRKGQISFEERMELLGSFKKTLAEGIKNHPQNENLIGLKRAIEKEILEVGTGLKE